GELQRQQVRQPGNDEVHRLRRGGDWQRDEPVPRRQRQRESHVLRVGSQLHTVHHGRDQGGRGALPVTVVRSVPAASAPAPRRSLDRRARGATLCPHFAARRTVTRRLPRMLSPLSLPLLALAACSPSATTMTTPPDMSAPGPQTFSVTFDPITVASGEENT